MSFLIYLVESLEYPLLDAIRLWDWLEVPGLLSSANDTTFLLLIEWLVPALLSANLDNLTDENYYG